MGINIDENHQLSTIGLTHKLFTVSVLAPSVLNDAYNVYFSFFWAGKRLKQGKMNIK